MNLIIDIGNTFVKMVSLDGDTIRQERVTLADEEQIRLFCYRQPFEAGIYCSVVDLPERIEQLLSELPFPMLRYQSGVTPIPLRSCYLTPLTLGADRMAAAVGASMQWPARNILIVDVGTCATFDFVSCDGEYLGGNISPGASMRLKAMHQFTGRLPLVELEGETPPFGTDTATAIRCGALTGLQMEIEGYARRYSRTFERLIVCLTGGGDGMSLDLPDVEVHYDQYLVPRGLNEILKWNRQSVRDELFETD